ASTRTDTPARAAAGSGAGKENFERGKRAYKNKEYKTAAKEFEKAVSQNPNKAKYHYNLGLAHMKLKDYQDALASLRKADRIDPAHKFTKKPDIYFDKVQELLTLIKDKKDAKKEAWEKSRRAKAIKSGGNKLLWGAVIAGAIGFVIHIIRRQGRRSSIGADSIVDEMDYSSYGNDRYSSSTRSTGSFFNFKKKQSKWKKKKHHRKHRDDGYYDRDRYADSDRYDRYAAASTIVSSSSTDDDYTASRYDES
ncbi:MAG: tetratricopeptide repeat protein, partial [bacterium]|nr:tetratricopeptide repeat protein [bacterium]